MAKTLINENTNNKNQNVTNPYYKIIPSLSAGTNENVTTMGGIASKGLYFIALTVIGVMIYFLGIVPEEYLTITALVLIVIALISGFVCYRKPMSVPVFGSIYTLSQGFLIGWICDDYSNYYEGIVPIALGVTFTVVFVMLILYTTGIIKVTARFRAIVVTLFAASIVFSLITWISSFFTSVLSSVVYGNGFIGILLALVFVVIAALQLTVDFDNIYKGVNNRIAKPYEWLLAFGLIVTVIVLFLRILSLLSKIMPRK